MSTGHDFGINEWLVEERRREFLANPSGVDEAWRKFFAAVPGPRPPAAPTLLRGAAARLAANMDASLTIPAATSSRVVQADALSENRLLLNEMLGGGAVSVTHLVGYAMVRAAAASPPVNSAYTVVGGRPSIVTPDRIDLGLAVDVPRPDGSRLLRVPCVPDAGRMAFPDFRDACRAAIDRTRNNEPPEVHHHPTISLTNTGALGTSHSVPRLTAGQGAILAVGTVAPPPGFHAMPKHTRAELGVGRTMTLSVTFDHRVIQGAAAGEFLRAIDRLLSGEDGFYDEIFAALGIPFLPFTGTAGAAPAAAYEAKAVRVTRLIDAYRSHGHLVADTDPLRAVRRRHPDLEPHTYGLTLWDLDREFPVDGFAGRPVMALRDILSVLRRSYCGRAAVEYMHIADAEVRHWIRARVESERERPGHAERLDILHRLTAAETFESVLHTRYVGQKRFSLEGGESMVVLLARLLGAGAESSLSEVAIGMNHRGRLNVLTNVVGKPHREVVAQFEPEPADGPSPGDVKYNFGAGTVFTDPYGRRIPVTLLPNPSHLESIDPVLVGFARARQDALDAGPGVLPVLLHGDAAFAGQGVVAETLNLSQLPGYHAGGTVHVVVNNQIGFTTPPGNARSAPHPTAVARMIDAPVLHVNGDDPEACAWAARLAFHYRQVFHRDVVIDLVCYRRRGHNEGDDPSMTQPAMHEVIAARRPVRQRYADLLVAGGDLTAEEADGIAAHHRAHLEAELAAGRRAAPALSPAADVTPSPVGTSISEETVKRVVDVHLNLPDGFTVHPRVRPQMQRRARMVADGTIDWAMGETLALGSLLLDGVPVRLVGEDSRRGTFGQRHHLVIDPVTGREHVPLSTLGPRQAAYAVHNSPLSEFAAMGFEYGYSIGRPEALVIWEAQYGDFANGAQTVIDEYVAAGEQRWGQRSALTLLLPHGHEGQGPNHSSARVERFLQLCAQDNMTVAAPSTPASFFHLLRRQGLGPYRRPLVVFTPKSMLRLTAASSRIQDFTGGGFRPVIGDAEEPPGGVRRILICSGKIYWDLLAARTDRGRTRTAITRLEQLHPVPTGELAAELARYPAGAEVCWVQEEPANQGAWPFLGLQLPPHLTGRPLRCVSPPASAATATGSATGHERTIRRVLEDAFAVQPD